MNTLRLKRNAYPVKIEGQEPSTAFLSDFVIDGMSLAEQYNLNAWFGSTCFEDTGLAREYAIEALLGKQEPGNQFGSGRLVLFRCHCGCHYCGVISCHIEQKNDVVTWSDIRYENDEDDPEYPKQFTSFSFARERKAFYTFFS